MEDSQTGSASECRKPACVFKIAQLRGLLQSVLPPADRLYARRNIDLG